MIPPIPTEWWLRPPSRAARVGEQRAVVWNRVYFRPLAARRSKFGVLHGPPKAELAPKPDVVDEDDEDVGCAVRWADRLDRGELGVWILGVVGGDPDPLRIGDGKVVPGWSVRFSHATEPTQPLWSFSPCLGDQVRRDSSNAETADATVGWIFPDPYQGSHISVRLAFSNARVGILATHSDDPIRCKHVVGLEPSRPSRSPRCRRFRRHRGARLPGMGSTAARARVSGSGHL